MCVCAHVHVLWSYTFAVSMTKITPHKNTFLFLRLSGTTHLFMFISSYLVYHFEYFPTVSYLCLLSIRKVNSLMAGNG